MGNEKMERTRGIANLIQELLRGVQNYTFGPYKLLKSKYSNRTVNYSNRTSIIKTIIFKKLPECKLIVFFYIVQVAIMF